MRKMKHADNQINLCPFSLSHVTLFVIRDFEQTSVEDALLV